MILSSIRSAARIRQGALGAACWAGRMPCRIRRRITWCVRCGAVSLALAERVRVSQVRAFRVVPMTSKCTAQLLADLLGVTHSLSRPQGQRRQPLLRGAVQDPEVPSRFPRALRRRRRRDRFLPLLLPLVQHRASTWRDRDAHPTFGSRPPGENRTRFRFPTSVLRGRNDGTARFTTRPSARTGIISAAKAREGRCARLPGGPTHDPQD